MGRSQRRHEADPFHCTHCRQPVGAQSFGTRHRNHCPHCLWSRHVDDGVGDRLAACRAPMQPIAIEVRDEGEWAIIHRCTCCGTVKTNRIAGDDSERARLMLALRPLANPPFPLE